MGAVHMRMPTSVVLAITLVACHLGGGSEAASPGDLLLFDNATASIVVNTHGLRTRCMS
jgi:hypothetical protein